jgi:hypothetical protein
MAVCVTRFRGVLRHEQINEPLERILFLDRQLVGLFDDDVAGALDERPVSS